MGCYLENDSARTLVMFFNSVRLIKSECVCVNKVKEYTKNDHLW